MARQDAQDQEWTQAERYDQQKRDDVFGTCGDDPSCYKLSEQQDPKPMGALAQVMQSPYGLQHRCKTKREADEAAAIGRQDQRPDKGYCKAQPVLRP